ncbi:putative cytochrome P450 [Tanacetum coccineum]
MISNGVFRVELEVESIIHKMREGRLRWFGHVKRRPHTFPVRRVEALLVDGLRRRGRPKHRWKDKLKQDMKELLLSEDMTLDRNPWRDRITKRSTFKTKIVPSSKGRLNLLLMDLYGPMRIKNINGKKYIMNFQVQVITVRIDRGTKFLNKTLHAYFKEEGTEHQTSIAQTPEQNGIVDETVL